MQLLIASLFLLFKKHLANLNIQDNLRYKYLKYSRGVDINSFIKNHINLL